MALLSVGVSVTVGDVENALEYSQVGATVCDALRVQLLPEPPVIVVPAVTPGPYKYWPMAIVPFDPLTVKVVPAIEPYILASANASGEVGSP